MTPTESSVDGAPYKWGLTAGHQDLTRKGSSGADPGAPSVNWEPSETGHTGQVP